MLQTNALYQENNPALPVKSSRSVKYKSIIKPIYDSTKTKRKSTKKFLKGSGTVFLSQDPNVLVSRLELLMASQQGGILRVLMKWSAF